MTVSNASDSGDQTAAKLPRRDWIVLPLISLLTICLLGMCADLVAHTEFKSSKTSLSDCLVGNDAATGVRAIPNSVCWGKAAEAELVQYRINNCGLRADFACEPKAADTYRIVAVGSSYMLRDQVANNDSFASRLPLELSQKVGRRVEVYNNGMVWGTPHSISLRLNGILRSQTPDMVLWALTPWDIQNSTVDLPPSNRTSEHAGAKPTDSRGLSGKIQRLRAHFTKDELPPSVVTEILLVKTMVGHFLYQSQSLYLKSYLMNSSDAGFLEVEPSAEWAAQLKEFDGYAARMEEQAAAAHVPLVVVLLPNRAQAAMISMGEWPAGTNPYRLDNELKAIVTSHGGIYIDILPGFRSIPNPERYYHAVDGHPDARGHEIIAGLLAKALASGPAAALTNQTKPQIVHGVAK
jgi:hypothetical protein